MLHTVRRPKQSWARARADAGWIMQPGVGDSEPCPRASASRPARCFQHRPEAGNLGDHRGRRRPPRPEAGNVHRGRRRGTWGKTQARRRAGGGAGGQRSESATTTPPSLRPRRTDSEPSRASESPPPGAPPARPRHVPPLAPRPHGQNALLRASARRPGRGRPGPGRCASESVAPDGPGLPGPCRPPPDSLAIGTRARRAGAD